MKVDVSRMPVPVPLALLGASTAGRVLFVILRFLDMPDGVSWAWGLYSP